MQQKERAQTGRFYAVCALSFLDLGGYISYYRINGVIGFLNVVVL